jgi:hypothetical protein
MNQSPQRPENDWKICITTFCSKPFRGDGLICPDCDAQTVWNDDVDCDLPCPNCDSDTRTAQCSECGGEGGHDGYEYDPLWYSPGDIIPCGLCGGAGCFHWCPVCNWDLNLPKKFNLPIHRQRAVSKFDARFAIL